MKILITGGAGFLGSELVSHLSAHGHAVWSYDHYVIEERVEDEDGNEFVRVPGDVLDVPHLFKTVRDVAPDVIVHAAAVVGPPASIYRPAHVARVNVTGGVNVMEATLQHDVGRMIDISSEEIYGHFQADTIDEEHPQDPNSPYGVTKLAVERLGLQYADHFGLDFVAGRVCWAYGHRYPRVRPPQSWIKDALAGRKTVMEQGGDHLLDITYVDDVAQGFRLLCEAEHLDHRAYHVTSGVAVTLREVAEELSQLLDGWEYEIGPGMLEMGPGFIAAKKGALRNDRAREELGFEPKYDLRSGLAANIARLKEVGA